MTFKFKHLVPFITPWCLLAAFLTDDFMPYNSNFALLLPYNQPFCKRHLIIMAYERLYHPHWTSFHTKPHVPHKNTRPTQIKPKIQEQTCRATHAHHPLQSEGTQVVPYPAMKRASRARQRHSIVFLDSNNETSLKCEKRRSSSSCRLSVESVQHLYRNKPSWLTNTHADIIHNNCGSTISKLKRARATEGVLWCGSSNNMCPLRYRHQLTASFGAFFGVVAEVAALPDGVAATSWKPRSLGRALSLPGSTMAWSRCMAPECARSLDTMDTQALKLHSAEDTEGWSAFMSFLSATHICKYNANMHYN